MSNKKIKQKMEKLRKGLFIEEIESVASATYWNYGVLRCPHIGAISFTFLQKRILTRLDLEFAPNTDKGEVKQPFRWECADVANLLSSFFLKFLRCFNREGWNSEQIYIVSILTLPFLTLDFLVTDLSSKEIRYELDKKRRDSKCLRKMILLSPLLPRR